MRIVRSAAAMQRLSKHWQQAGLRVAFVPTMGFLHAGHSSLIQRARKSAGRAGKVVVSIYVNPAQFGAGEDFSRYPRDLKRDTQLCRAEGVDVLFTPSDTEMYPRGGAAAFSTFVTEESLSPGMEGASRPGHFRGVATVLVKLFNLVQPGVAVFGAKDFQQAAVVRRMVRDLNFPLKIIVAPTFREPDGLAMSSRNQYLSPDERRQAVVLWKIIQRSRKLVSRRPVSALTLKKEVLPLLRKSRAARLDYIAFFDPASLCPLQTVGRGSHVALAIFVGKTRLIDNARL